MLKGPLLFLLLAIASTTSAAAAVSGPRCVSRGNVPIRVTPVAPPELGAVMRRTAGWPAPRPFVGSAALQSALAVTLPRGRRLVQAQIRPFDLAPVTLVLTTGERVVVGTEVDKPPVRSDSCRAAELAPLAPTVARAERPKPLRPKDLASGFALAATTDFPRMAAWSHGGRRQTRFYWFRDRDAAWIPVMTLPIALRAFDAVADPHGRTANLIVVGETGHRLVLASFAFYGDPPTFLPPE